jgi:DNA-directed RNA polymerase subunit RPC12/RpoP
MTSATFLEIQCEIQCTCKASFVADLDDYTNFARCPDCGNVVWIKADATVYELDPVEYPDSEMIAEGRAPRPVTPRHRIP